jgi:hypothetical protein
MSTDATSLVTDMELLRRDGSIVARCNSEQEAAGWRAAIRKACRDAGLRVRTGLANADAQIAWAYHVDHVVTEAARRAALRAIEAALSGTGQEPVPFHELVREEQRKMLRIIPPASD